MELHRDMNAEKAPRKASEWLAALLERPDDAALRRRFDHWLAADTANAKDWAEMARTYEVMGRTAPRHRDQWVSWAAQHRGSRRLPDAAVPAPAPFAVHARSKPMRWGRRIATGIVAAGIAAAVALVVFPEVRWRLTADHATATAEVYTIRLPDGSTARLAPESALDVADDGHERGVRLLHGAAFFEVVRDPSRPFRVETEAIRTTVLGTAFEVRVDGSGADVAVRQGSVRIEQRMGEAPHAEVLKAGDWVAARSGQWIHGSQPPAQVAAWLQGRLIARDRPVREVVDALRPYYRGIVILRGDALAEKTLTGVYDLTDPIAALKAVASALGIRAQQISPWVFVISGG